MKKSDKDLVEDIIDHCTCIIEESRPYESLETALAQNRLFKAAMERWILNIGEACHKLSPSFKANHPTIPWNTIIGMRNILAHDYDEVAEEIIANVIKIHLPPLRQYLTQINLEDY